MGIYKIITAKAPVNIAVIKYWGKANEQLKIPINDSISGTLSIDDLCATTTIIVSDTYDDDQLWLNKKRQDLEKDGQRFKILIEHVRSKSQDKELASVKAHIFSENNFPTAAGLASSAAGFACLSFVLGHAYGITDRRELSIFARIGSGSACRSLYGGFVRWHRGHDSDSSVAEQLFDHQHWPEMRVVICVVNDNQKEISSSIGMRYSTETSKLLGHRAEKIVPLRITAMNEAIRDKDFESFAKITMVDSNQFHAVCLDTWPPIRYLNDQTKVAYTFDAGPNACIYTTEDMLDILTAVIRHFYPPDDGDSMLIIKGLNSEPNKNITGDLLGIKADQINDLTSFIKEQNHVILRNSLSYLISTRIGEGPKLVQDHLSHP